MSGAREAEPIDPDSDSLMEWHGDNQYAAEFTPMVCHLPFASCNAAGTGTPANHCGACALHPPIDVAHESVYIH